MAEGVNHTTYERRQNWIHGDWLQQPTCPKHPDGGPTCWHDATPDEIRNLGTAMRLSGGNITICEALLRGETVPLSKLDQDAVRRLGRR